MNFHYSEIYAGFRGRPRETRGRLIVEHRRGTGGNGERASVRVAGRACTLFQLRLIYPPGRWIPKQSRPFSLSVVVVVHGINRSLPRAAFNRDRDGRDIDAESNGEKNDRVDVTC